MSADELYTKGARVWVPDSELVWKGAILKEDYTGQKKLKIEYEEDGLEDEVKVESKDKLPPLRNPEILIGENDLTSLSYLHEPAVLHNLQVRFIERNAIYTYCGIVLVAINPYEALPIYGQEIIQAYSGQDQGTMDPHIFAVAEEAFKQMHRFERNQSIIVSGESGAGKTVSAKFAMRYFASVGGSQTDETQIEKRVLASNPIMEAIGNAKTTRNDNSSRFGKYIEIGFSKQNIIVTANMRTYLLEKSRVVFQAPDERNYHIFYQLCASSELPEFEDFGLKSPDEFWYTAQGENPDVTDVDDAEELVNTREAFTLLGFSEQQQMMIFRIVAGILHFGNVEIKQGEKREELSVVPNDDEAVLFVAKLLGIEADSVRTWLCCKKIQTAKETLTTPLTVRAAIFAREALTKHIYACLFDWIVAHINKSLLTSVKMHKFIGVLDIYGFETFEINSFEQFCINYANEKLQQQFCLHVFKLEQEEYIREAIEWSMIDFYDNQPCINLIEAKLGILDLLDEECRMPKGSDDNWCRKLYDKHSKAQHFSKPRMSNTAFIIHHFADDVEYQSNGFLEKNRDTIYEELLNMLKASTFEFVADLFLKKEEVPRKRTKSGSSSIQMRAGREGAKTGSKQNKSTVGSQFRTSLTKLMDTLFSTTPHYVRCIKPNDEKEAFNFDPQRAVQQLRACGVLETIRISAAGYPSRWTYGEFFQRYRVLATSRDINRKDMKNTCESVLTHYIQDPDKFQFGKTKIFFRAGQVAYLEKLRSDKLRACGVMIQKHVRGWLCRKRYQKIRKSVMLVQRFGRGLLARRKALHLKQTSAATKIQKTWRGYHDRQTYIQTRQAVITIQAYARGLFGRRHFTNVLQEKRAVTIQRMVRGWLARCRYKKIIFGIVKLQSHVRRRMARKQFKILKIEARSVEHIKHVNKGLENKIIQLQQRLDEKNKENNVLREDQVKHNRVINELEQLKSKPNKTEGFTTRIAELEKLVKQLETVLATERDEKQDLISEKQQILQEHEQVITMMAEEKGSLRDELNQANQRFKEMESSVEDSVKEKLKQSEADFHSDREHHQKLIKEYARLQQRFENLQDEVKVLTAGPSHSRTPSNVSGVSVKTEVDIASEKTDQEKDEGYNSVRTHKKVFPDIKGEDTTSDISVPLTSDTSQLQNGNYVHTVSSNQKSGEKDVDVGLILKLQNKVKELEREKKRLQAELDRLDSRGRSDSHLSDTAFDALKMTELEMENNKLKEELRKLQKATAEETGQSEVFEQFQAMEAELERRRDECLQLRSLLANRTIDTREVAKESYGGHEEMLNEDGELIMAYKTQKDINKVLERDLQDEKDNSKKKESELRDQIEELKQDNERQQRLIGQNLTLTPEAKIEATMQHEITRLTSENLDLREVNDKQAETVKKLKKALKIYHKKLKMEEGAFLHVDSEMGSQEDSIAIVKHQEREYLGMLEYRKEEEGMLIRNLIFDLKPKLATMHLPGLPAYVLFMIIRHTDYMNDDDKVRSLLTNTINGIRKNVKKRHEDLETVTMWLSNTSRLLHSLKQYSGEKVFQHENTPKQNEHCLRNFDLSEYRQVLSDLAVWIYQGLTKLMQEGIQPMIVAAVLEHEAIAGLSSSKPVGYRGRSASSGQELEADAHYSLDSLVRKLNSYYKVLTNHAVDPELLKQIFKQLFYSICGGALNNLLLRKEMCNWSKGMQIRYNLSHLEQWIRDHKLQDAGAMDVLEPVIQASQLLQARKTEADVASVCEMCSRLTMPQIIKILNLYTPVDEYEERVPISFIRKIQAHLKTRKDQSKSLLMDTKYSFPVMFPFAPSNISLETIVIPEALNLHFLRRV